MKSYELIEHTADVGIRVKGGDLKDLFKNTASAMFDIMAEKKPNIKYLCPRQIRLRRKVSTIKEVMIKQKAEDLQELFINWLNELLSLSAVKELIFSDFKINKFNENALEATVIGRDIKNYKVNTEIKAATYHQLKIEKTPSGWQAEVILDV